MKIKLQDITEWHEFYCILPRRIENHWVMFHLVEQIGYDYKYREGTLFRYRLIP